MADIDELQIKIKADSAKASNSIESLVNSMNRLRESISFDTAKLSNIASGIRSMVSALSKIGGKASTQATKNLPALSAQLQNFVRQMNKIGALNFDMTNMSNLVTSISRLGSVASGRAVTNIPLLADNLKYLFETLSKAPNVSANILQMTQALGNLSNRSGGAITGLNNSISNLSGSFLGFKTSTGKALIGLKSFTRQILSSMGIYLGLYGAIRGIKNAIDISSTLTEVQNVVDVTFGDMSKKVNDFAQDSIRQFGMSELTLKQTASRFQAMGTAMGIDSSLIKKANEFLNKQTDGYIGLSDSMADVSLNLTKLTADMASLYNIDQDVVSQDLAAIFTGQTRPLRDYGLDLTQATLKEWAMKQGLDSDIASMSQAEKTMLRYQYVLANTQTAQGDFARTADSWANQIRILKQSFEQLGSVIGGALINAFKPFVKALNSVLLVVISFVTKVTNALGAIFGWKYEDSGAGLADNFSDAAESADDVADSTGQAAKNIDKMNKGVRQFDELKLITTNDGSGKKGSGGSGGGGASGGASGGKLVKTDTIFKNYESDIKNLKQLGKYISDALSKAMESINWDKIYSKARNFGKGLADFLNGLINPRLFGNVGKTIAGALNTALEFLNSFGTRFNWKNFGNSIAAGINKFFKTFKFTLLARTLNTWAKGLLDAMISAIDGVNWYRIGKKIGEFLSDIDWLGICGKIAQVIWKAINAGLSTWSGIFSAAPIEATILGVIAAIKISTITLSALDNIKTKILAIKDTLLNFAATVVAHPYLAIAAAIAAIGLAVYNFHKSWQKEIADQFLEFEEEIGSNNQKMEDAAQNLRDLADTTKDLTSKSEASADQLQQLADSYFELADKTSLTAADQETLKTRAQQLIDICPELANQIDMTTGKYTAQKEELLKTIEAQKEYYRVAGYKDVVEQYSKALAEANVELEVSEQNYKDNAEALDKLNEILSDIGATEDLNDWWKRNTDALKANGIEAKNAGDAHDELVKQMVFLEDEQTKITETQKTLRDEVAKATSQYNSANELLEQHTNEYNLLQQAIKKINFGVIAKNAVEAIDDLGGVFVNGKQVVGEEAVELYQTIIDAYGTTDQDMYNLGEKGVVQFGIGGVAGTAEAIPTMTSALEEAITTWYNGRGYDVAVAGGKVVVNGLADGGVAQSQSAVDTVTGAITQKGSLKDAMLSGMGRGWAKNTIDGYNNGISENSNTTNDAMLTYLENNIKQPFTTNMGIHSPSTVFSDYGKYTVEGFNGGVSGNQNTTYGVISSWVSNISSWFTNLMGIHSPSRVFKEFAGFTVEGFNNGISDGSKSTFKEIKNWSEGIKDSFGLAGLKAAPEVVYKYNRSITDNVNASIKYNSGSIESTIGKEMQIAMSSAIDYDKLGDVIVSKLEKADITAVLDSDKAYQGTVKKWRQEANRTQRNPVPIF
jgi:tetratricopeptide (TPR) repeat protein